MAIVGRGGRESDGGEGCHPLSLNLKRDEEGPGSAGLNCQAHQVPAVGNLSELLSAPVSNGDTSSFLSRAVNTGISADGRAKSPAPA